MTQTMARWLRDHSRQQAELFGMMLGHTSRAWYRSIVYIDDFEPFDPATLRGSPRPPHGSELKVVGLYRRRAGEQLVLDHLDASLIQTSFSHPGMVYLLIAPSDGAPDRAAFFIQEDGEVHGYTNYGEFPFDSEFLRRPGAGGSSDSSKLRRWFPLAGLAASLLAFGGWFFWLRQDTSAKVPPAAVAAPVAEKEAEVQPAPVPEKPKVAAPKPQRRKTEKARKKTTKSRKRKRSSN